MKLPLLVVVAWLVLASCQHSPSEPPPGPIDGWSFVATIGGLDSITQTHLHSLLNSRGIDCVIEVTVACGVSVPTDKHLQAIDIIKKDLQQRKYWITLYLCNKDLKYTIPSSEWKVYFPRRNYEELISHEQYKASTDVGAVLRSPEMKNEILAFPYIACIKSLRREYLDSEQKVRTGHEVTLELAVMPNVEIGGKRMSFQVWEERKQIKSMGSNEWWHGEPEKVAANQKKYDRRIKKPFNRELVK